MPRRLAKPETNAEIAARQSFFTCVCQEGMNWIEPPPARGAPKGSVRKAFDIERPQLHKISIGAKPLHETADTCLIVRTAFLWD